MVGAALLVFVQTASAQNDLVVKFYACPQGQAAVTADSLRDEYGVIPGVRLAADERTSQVIVQAPPEVQARISQKLAAAFPNQQPMPEKATAGSVQVRQIPLKRIQAEQLEATLWNTLGNRLTALPNQQIASRGYRLALSNGGAVTISIDFANKQVKLEGPTAAVDAATRLVQVLDSPQDPAGKNVRVMPLQPAQLASVRRAASIIRSASGAPPASMPLAALLMQRPDSSPTGGTSAIPAPPAPGGRAEVPAPPAAAPAIGRPTLAAYPAS